MRMDTAASAFWADDPVAIAAGVVFPTINCRCTIPAGIVVEFLTTFRIYALAESGKTD